MAVNTHQSYTVDKHASFTYISFKKHYMTNERVYTTAQLVLISTIENYPNCWSVCLSILFV